MRERTQIHEHNTQHSTAERKQAKEAEDLKVQVLSLWITVAYVILAYSWASVRLFSNVGGELDSC